MNSQLADSLRTYKHLKKVTLKLDEVYISYAVQTYTGFVRRTFSDYWRGL